MRKPTPNNRKSTPPAPPTPPASPVPAPASAPAPDPPAPPAPLDPPAPGCWRRHRALPLFLAVPFAVFYWCLPFFGKFTLGNDYTIYSIGAQMELLYSICRGSYPLFFPRQADGFAAAGLTLSQLHHPFTWIVGLAPGYWSGHALDLMTLLRLLSLGLTQYVLYRLLRRLRLGLAFSLLLSFITVYNLRMLDSMRYGASLENYTAYLLLMAALAWSWIRPLPRWSFLWVALAAWLLIVGGHPQFMYFGLLGAAVMILVLPVYLDMMLPGEVRPGRHLRFYGASALALGAGLALATASWLPFYWDYLRKETIRVGLNYDWAIVNQDSLLGTLNSFFNPYHSDVHGTFGGSALIILAAAVPLLTLAGVRIPRVIGLLWLLLVLTVAYQLGSATPVHYVFWRFVPFASSFRVPGRMAFLNPFTILLLLAWLARLEPLEFKIRSRLFAVAPIGLLAALAAVVYVIYDLARLDQLKIPETFTPALLYKTIRTGISYNHIPPGMFTLVYFSGLASLLLLALRGAARSRWPAAALSFALCAAVAVQTGAVLRYGTWIEARKPTPTLAEMDAQRKTKLGSLAQFSIQGERSRDAEIHDSRGGDRDARPGMLHSQIVNVSSPDEIYTKDRASPWMTKIGVEGGMMALPPVPPDGNTKDNTLKLTYSSFNRLVFEANCPYPAVCTLGFPYSDGRWRARVNGQPAKVYKAFGFGPAVRVSAGDSTVEFRYFTPTPLIGFLLGFAAALALVYWVTSGLAGRRKGLLAFPIGFALCAALFILICFSLYHGQDLGTEFKEFYPVF